MLTKLKPSKISVQHLIMAGVPKKYWDANILTLPYSKNAISCVSSSWKYIKNIRKLSSEGIGLYIYSEEKHTGKTTIAITIIKAALSYGGICHYHNFHDIIDIIKKSKYGKASSSEMNTIYLSTFLVIDNIDIQSEEEERIIDKIISNRSSQKKPSILIPKMNRITMFGSSTLGIIENEMMKICPEGKLKSHVSSVLESLC